MNYGIIFSEELQKQGAKVIPQVQLGKIKIKKPLMPEKRCPMWNMCNKSIFGCDACLTKGTFFLPLS